MSIYRMLTQPTLIKPFFFFVEFMKLFNAEHFTLVSKVVSNMLQSTQKE